METSDVLSQSLDRLQQGDKNSMEGHAQKMKMGFFSKWQKIYLVLSRTELRLYKGSSIRRSHDENEKVEVAQPPPPKMRERMKAKKPPPPKIDGTRRLTVLISSPASKRSKVPFGSVEI